VASPVSGAARSMPRNASAPRKVIDKAALRAPPPGRGEGRERSEGRWRPAFGAKHMRGLARLLAIIYLVGIGVALAPTVRANWQSSTSVLYTNVVRDLPAAFAWPVTAVRALLNY
jgi:hypothetical protein